MRQLLIVLPCASFKELCFSLFQSHTRSALSNIKSVNCHGVAELENSRQPPMICVLGSNYKRVVFIGRHYNAHVVFVSLPQLVADVHAVLCSFGELSGDCNKLKGRQQRQVKDWQWKW